MSKSTHFNYANVSNMLRVGGAGIHMLGGQSVTPDRVPNNWYPKTLPTATASAPQNSDVAALLDNLGRLVAVLTIQQSVFLANVYRTVQAGVVAGGTFSILNPANSTTYTSATTTSFFDQNIAIKEAVAVDVVNKNPSLTYDLALRLAIMTAAKIDAIIAAKYASLTISTVGTAATTPTPANLATQINLIPNTGEPILGFFLSATVQAYLNANPSQTQYNGSDPVIVPTGANKPIRLLASDAIVASTGNRNMVMTPSAFAFITADQGTSTGSAPQITPSGTVTIRASNFFDPEFGTQPQLSLQLVCGNTGSGAQTVYVNLLGNVIAVNAGNGGVVLS